MSSIGMRRAGLGVTGAVAALLALASFAWACTDVMQGKVWFCPTTTSCTEPTTAAQFKSGRTVYSKAASLPQPNRTYRLKYTTSHNQHASCMTSSSFFGDFTTNSFNSWMGKAVTLPTVASSTNYTQCAVYPTTGTPTEASEHSTGSNFTVVP